MFSRFVRLLRGFFGLFVSDLEKRSPDALLELEKERLRKEIANYNQGLTAHAALCERLMSQGKKLETEERELRARTAADLRNRNRTAAGEAALLLQSVRRDLAVKSKEMEQAEATYKQLLNAREAVIRQAQEKLATLKQQIDDLKMQRATAELAEMAAGLTNNLGGNDTLNRLEQMVEDERQLAAGRIRVARDSMPAPVDATEMEASHRALADEALAEFEAREASAANRPALPYSPDEPEHR